MSMLVETTYGPVEGFVDTYGLESRQNIDGQGTRPAVSKWLGIPYAQAGRWERPGPASKWTEPLKAHEFGTAFPQPPSGTDKLLKGQEGFFDRDWVRMSEESHFINVMGPQGCHRQSKLLPVLVFIYGGSLNNGSSERPTYDATELVRSAAKAGNDFIFVSFNYRTNVFGFCSSPDLAALDAQGLCGNYGLYDCVAAFEWVQANIEKFGGNKDNVTAMGHSAGSFLVSHLLVSGKRLFQKACAHSGCVSTMGHKPVGESYPAHAHITSAYGPSAATARARIEGLRKVDWQDLLQGHIESYKPGGVALTIEPKPHGIWTEKSIQRLERGEWDPWIEHVILGTTEDEGSLFTLGLSLTTPEAIDGWISQYSEPVQAQVRAKFPIPPADVMQDQKRVFLESPGGQIFMDEYFVAPAFEQADALAGTKNVETGKPCRVYMYRVRCEMDALSHGKVDLGATHIIDIPLLFNVNTFWKPESHEAGSAKALRDRWLSFLSTGNPGHEWKPYDPAHPTWLAFEKGGQTRNEDVTSVVDALIDYKGRGKRARPNALSIANE